jgi:serine/threonine-protein kinase
LSELIFGPFRMLLRLGQGGMGEVWKASTTGADGVERTIVVKRVLAHLLADPEIAAMFAREARLSVPLVHPNVVRTYDTGQVDGQFYLSMEYVPGIDLRLLLSQTSGEGPLPPGLAAHAVRGVCGALAYAYNLAGEDGLPRRLVHRDVTPSNVLLGLDGSVKLLDFGIAKALSEATEHRTAVGTLKGKFAYMAPEQVEGGAVDHRTDQFAAGVVLHEALTGRRLFRGDSDVQTLAKVKEAQVDPPSRWNAAIPAELDEICLRALSRDPTARFPDCAAMAHALSRVLAQLGWDEVQTARFVSAHVERRAGERGPLALPSDDGPKHTRRQGMARPQQRTARVALPAFVACAALAGGVWWWQRAAVHPPASVIDPPRAEAPPMPATAAQPVETASPRVEAPPPATRLSLGLGELELKPAVTRAPEPSSHRRAPKRGSHAPPPRVKAAQAATAPESPKPRAPDTSSTDVRTGAVLDPFQR